MEETIEPQMNYVGKRMAYYSALIGTLILITYLISHADFLAVVGVIYILSATVVNTLVLMVVLIELICNQSSWRSSVVTIICMLLNIPLVILYLFILSYFHL